MIRISIVFLDLFFKGKRPQIEHDVGDDVIKLTSRLNQGNASHARLTAGGAMAGDQSSPELLDKSTTGIIALGFGSGS